MECADAANGVDGHIMADGGCVHQVILLKHLEVEAHGNDWWNAIDTKKVVATLLLNIQPCRWSIQNT